MLQPPAKGFEGNAFIRLIHILPLCISSFRSAESSGAIIAQARDETAQTHATFPMSFERNDGQTAAEVTFLARGRGYSLYLTATQAVLSLPGRAVKAGPT